MAALVRATPGFTEFKPAAWDDSLFWNVESPAEERSQYFAVGNAINFRFWQLVNGEIVPAVGTIDGTRLRGSMYMWRCLRRCVDSGTHPILDAGYLATMPDRDLTEIFTDDFGDNPLSVAADERLANLRDLGTRLETSWDGWFYNVVKRSAGSIVAFARLSHEFRAWDDPVHKLTMVNAIVHSGSGLAVFDDQVLPGIDYHLLRHLLRQGVLKPVPSLSEKLLSREPLSAREGYELRRTALSAFITLAEDTGVSGEVIDNKFWANRSKCTDTAPVCTDPRTAAECPFLGACERLVTFALPVEWTRYY
jgi:hypothetical protein